MRYCSANFSCIKPTWGLPRYGGVAALVDVASVRVLVGSSSGSGDAIRLGTLETILERGYDLPKRQMFESGSGLILRNSQFPNVGGLAPCGMFVFLGLRLGFFALGLGSFMLMNLRELAEYQVAQSHASRRSACRLFVVVQNNNNNTIWGGSVLTGEEPPPHSGELKHALPQAGGPTKSQLSRPMSSGHHISMEHRLRRKQLNSDTNASNKQYLKEVQEKRKEDTFSSTKMKKENEKHFF